MKIKYLDKQRQAMEESLDDLRAFLKEKGTPKMFFGICVYDDGKETETFRCWAGNTTVLEKVGMLTVLAMDIWRGPKTTGE